MRKRLWRDDLIDTSLSVVSLRSGLADGPGLCFLGGLNSSTFRLDSCSSFNTRSFSLSSLSSSRSSGLLHLRSLSGLDASSLGSSSFSSLETSDLGLRTLNSLNSSSLDLRGFGSLDTSGFRVSSLGSLNLRLLEPVIVIPVVDVATTLTLSNAARAAFELALDVQEVHHFFCGNPAAALEYEVLLHFFQDILVYFNGTRLRGSSFILSRNVGQTRALGRCSFRFVFFLFKGGGSDGACSDTFRSPRCSQKGEVALCQ
jgi:hypothetical protein